MASQNAEQELRRAQSLEEYRRAVEQLERELLKLSGDTLTPEQQRQRDQLQITAQQGRTTLAQEDSDLARLERASQALNNAEERGGEKLASQLSAARQELDGVPPRSFSAAEASRLRERLDALASRPGSPGGEEIPSSQGSGPAEADPPPQRSWSPPPPPPASQLPQPSAPGGATGSTPYRVQPLF
ncbi:hypothetical protein KBZ15_08270 [Cyanobium sp. BA20m-p-22]|uniref:hypothetical protein n=1 Tax=Cyanobium sp. BA20m-p-22 TaxID=2823704 RepID=UPI0020CBFB8F|nr:hypothetical protein [Cyanobium sp. BA20m-p-22]MCP9909899.1 hypothetical protein [Cyanobium sp. BA20m-p-22]